LEIPFACALKNFPEDMFQLFREIFKPLKNYLSDAEYREWIYVKSRCNKKKPGTPVTLNISGYKVSGQDASSFLHQYNEIFVQRAFETKFQSKNPVIYCCGANIGIEIFFFKKQYPESKIKAFEADPQISKILSENVSQNNLQNVEVISAAVWKENGTLDFQPDGALGGKTGSGYTSVKSIRLADELKKENKIDLLIIDIEGVELEVLKDCREELKKAEHLFVEWHGDEKQSQNLNELLQLLSESGFRYRLNNNLSESPFHNRVVENGFDAMVEIYATRS
jgi:FkbM family methyltransferase